MNSSRSRAPHNTIPGSQYGAQPTAQVPPTPPVSRQSTLCDSPVPTAARPSVQSGLYMVQEGEENARPSQSHMPASSAGHATSQPGAPLHTSHQASEAQPAALRPDQIANIIALHKAGVSNDVIMTSLGLKKQGHTYGGMSAKDGARAIRGNILKSPEDIAHMASHGYGKIEVSGFNARVQDGDVYAEWASSFLGVDPSDHLPAPPAYFPRDVGANAGANAGVNIDEDSDEDSEEDFS